MQGRKRNPHTMQLREWYGTGLWKRRRRLQLIREPWCAICARSGRAVLAVAADHRDGFKTYDEFVRGMLQSLCQQCSSARHPMRQAEPRRWTGLDGYVIDGDDDPRRRR